jgi:hypothetical protein
MYMGTRVFQRETGGVKTVKTPVYIRLPKNGERCPFTSISRSKLNQLILPVWQNDFKPPVKSVAVKRDGAKKGTRLILLESLLGYLRSLEQ